ncbi:tyrosine-protein kinase EpsD [Liquorilactobacillus sucicola DSM 21376 = JCM 15457]|uniref:Tyrosine-protein kinase CpsD n=1 Tax=Liquorilactobacillus sucicola DSM 21376 = JCM 15457 TaxID=1423806 RepID=A0A023CWK7_9LACO|nr:CpsD/CapB family tyrosine-protein kinase [Liquorilactobacillus sucicola]KRN06324.1 tyrosine-protein kinase [Liquorilactobacillus sucicola DSM 21376 = JCM 15457]GAJ26268.1 tyrosine-protein kinase EpsD [Liquorilactobacillus sucicola DSM 21376 = JCM 15457]
MFDFWKKKKLGLSTNSMENGVYMITVVAPSSVVAEQFKTIRTNIQFSNVDQHLKTLMVTSSIGSEGKSTIAANLAITFADQGLKTLLVDTDTRRPTLSATFGISNLNGLTNYLTDCNFDINTVIYRTTIEKMFVLPSGPVPPNPSELLNSQRMDALIKQLSERFDLVIYDAPPVLSFTDAQVLSTKIEATILVVRENVAEKEVVRRSVNLLKHVKAHLIGNIFNDHDTSGGNGYYGYGYYDKDD